MPWPNTLISYSRIVDLDTPNETEWHGLWNTILFMLFPSTAHEDYFEITIERIAPQTTQFMPDWNTFIVQLLPPANDEAARYTRAPLLFVEVRAHPELMEESSRARADAQMRSRFSYFCEALRIPRLYGISAMGPQIAVYEYTRATGRIEPAGEVGDGKRVRDGPGAEQWEWDVMSGAGEARIKAVAEDVRRMVREA